MSNRPKAIHRKRFRQARSSARAYWEAATKEQQPSNTRYLISRLGPSSPEAFPFEHALSHYLLFIAALWPNDHNRLLMAARLFAGSLNHQVAAVRRNRVFSFNQERFVFHKQFSQRKLALFNKIFFEEIGGTYSLLFTDSIAQFQTDVLKRVSELQMMHDVMNFLMKASVVSPRLSTSRLAFEAVATNFFKRRSGYGIHSGAKRKRSAERASTVNSVREKWKRAPDTVLLSFVMVLWFYLQNFSLADPKFLAYLQATAKTAGRSIVAMVRIIQRDLKDSSPKQNKSIEKWTEVLPPTPFTGGIGATFTFSDEELERVFELYMKVFKIPLSEEDKIQFWRNNKNALYDRLQGRRPPIREVPGGGKNQVFS